jgi:hypothetical protein
MKKLAHALVIVMVGLVARDAKAIGIGFLPSAIVASIGGSFNVDVVVSDLAGGIVSAYDLDVVYDAAKLTATSVSFGSLLGDSSLLQVLDDFDLSTGGIVDLAQLSLLSDAALAALQPDTEFVLATLGFSVVAEGSSTLSFSFDAFNDVKGVRNTQLDVVGGIATIRPPGGPAIPEPGAALLFGAGSMLLLLGVRSPARRA